MLLSSARPFRRNAMGLKDPLENTIHDITSDSGASTENSYILSAPDLLPSHSMQEHSPALPSFLPNFLPF